MDKSQKIHEIDLIRKKLMVSMEVEKITRSELGELSRAGRTYIDSMFAKESIMGTVPLWVVMMFQAWRESGEPLKKWFTVMCNFKLYEPYKQKRKKNPTVSDKVREEVKKEIRGDNGKAGILTPTKEEEEKIWGPDQMKSNPPPETTKEVLEVESQTVEEPIKEMAINHAESIHGKCTSVNEEEFNDSMNSFTIGVLTELENKKALPAVNNITLDRLKIIFEVINELKEMGYQVDIQIGPAE